MKYTNDLTPFDMKQKPSKQYPFLMPLIWGGSYLLTRQFGLKIEHKNMENIKPPFLVIGMHQGFSDYYIGPLSVFPRRAMFVSDMEGFEAFGKWLYRGLGCIGKRRYVSDIMVIKNIKYALSSGQSVFVYPESRHSNVGTTSYIPKNMGKLCKMLKVPVVVLTEHGSYLANPFWDEEHTRKVPIRATLTCIYNEEELQKASSSEIQAKIESMLAYDEYEYQRTNKIKIDYKKRAEGLHKPLFYCPVCKTKYHMISKDDYLSCTKCESKWNMSVYGELIHQGDEKKIHIPDWYEKERQLVISEPVDRSFNVNIEALPNEKGFVKMGTGRLTLDEEQFTLEFDDKKYEKIIFRHEIRESVQIEYNYKGQGMCIVLSTRDCCYYIYSKDENFNPTELQFIGEHLFKKSLEKKK